MESAGFMKVDEVAQELGVSKSHAYKVIKLLNDELSAKGYITVAGRISRQYFNERVYGAERFLLLSKRQLRMRCYLKF